MARSPRLQAEMAPVLEALDAGGWMESFRTTSPDWLGHYIDRFTIVKDKNDPGKSTTLWTFMLLANAGYIRRTKTYPGYQIYGITIKGSQRIRAFLARREKLLTRKSQGGK